MRIALSALGMKKRQIYETIVSTYDSSQKPTAAPMGMTLLDSESFLIRPFKATATYRNLRATKCGVVNITSSPAIFYRTTFKHEERRLKMPSRWFESGKVVQAPRVRSAEALVEFTVRRLEEENEGRSRFTCNVQLIEARRIFPQAYCRARFALIECIIHATRIGPYLSDGRVAEAEKLIHLVEYYRDLSNRVAPGSKDARTIASIISRIERWKKANAGLR
jgi:hypothetical protein